MVNASICTESRAAGTGGDVAAGLQVYDLDSSRRRVFMKRPAQMEVEIDAESAFQPPIPLGPRVNSDGFRHP